MMRRRLIAFIVVLLALSASLWGQSTSITSSGTLPATCTPKQIYYKTGASAGLYLCTAANTWTRVPVVIVPVADGGTGAAPASDDQVLVSSSTSAATWKTLTDCAGANQAVSYTASSNTWGCTSITGGGGGGVGTVTNTGTLTAGEQIVGNGSAYITALSSAITPQGRLTLTTGVPWMTASVTAQTTVYYTPAVGNAAPIYDGSVWTIKTFSELSQATTDATKSPAAAGTYSNYDVFLWNDSGTLRATRGPAWTQAQTFTVTIASPAVFSLTAHGFYEGEPLVFSTSGALPTGLTAGTTYFVIAAGLTANAFEVSATVGGAAVNTSGSQSGTHTATQNTTVRGTGAGTTELEFINGILMNKVAITNGPGADRGTYVGTIRTNGSSQVDMIFGGVGGAGGESAVLGLWNTYNRRLVTLTNFDNTDSWNYTTASFRLKNLGASTTANRILFVIGYQGDALQVLNAVQSSNTTAGVGNIAAVGFNATTTPVIGSATAIFRSTITTNIMGGVAIYAAAAPLGCNYVAPLEQSSASGTTTWYGDNGAVNNLTAITLTTMF